jgi:hypothetical protein
MAGTITEGTSPAPADFPNSGPGYLLPVGTTVVIGTLTQTTDINDWFEFQDLTAGTTFSLLGKYNPLHQEKQTSFLVYNSSSSSVGVGNAGVGHATLEGQGQIVTGTVPSDGILEVDVQGSRSGSAGYEIDLTASIGNASPAPEPSTMLGTGLALAGALAWRRKRKHEA